MTESQSSGLLPAVSYLKMPEGGEPYLEGHRCKNCGSIFLGERTVCSNCAARDQMEAIPLSNRGELYAYTIVHRSFPGIEVPFVSAIVDLNGGGTVKGNLINIDPNPEAIKMGMAVELVFKDAGRKDKEGNGYMAFFFQPAQS